MSKTKMQAGRLVAAYVDDGQGRRVVLADPNVGGWSRTMVVGMTQREVRATIATLHQLLEELPVDDGPDPRTRKDPIAAGEGESGR